MDADETTDAAGWPFDEDEPFVIDDLGDEDEDRRRRRRWVLIGLATLPWLVAAMLVLRGAGTSGADTDTTAAPDVAPAPTTSPTAAADTTSPGQDLLPTRATTAAPAGAPVGSEPGPQVFASGARSSITLADVGAVAIVVARDHLTGLGPRRSGTEQPTTPTYAEHLAVDAVDYPAPGYAVASVVAVLLTEQDGAYTGVELRRLAVPVRLHPDGPRPAGTPWPLPSPDLTPAPPEEQPFETDPEVAADVTAALTAAGYADITLDALTASDGWPLLAHVTARAPADDDVRPHTVWLRVHLGGLVVAGWLPEESQPPSDGATPDEQAPPPDPARSSSTASSPSSPSSPAPSRQPSTPPPSDPSIQEGQP